MAEENKNVETPKGQGNDEQDEQTQPEKKYTDEEVNNISVKNSKKAVAKLMNILYECKKPPAYSKAGLQLPSVLFLTDGYIRSIRDSDSSVKPKFENATKRL